MADGLDLAEIHESAKKVSRHCESLRHGIEAPRAATATVTFAARIARRVAADSTVENDAARAAARLLQAAAWSDVVRKAILSDIAIAARLRAETAALDRFGSLWPDGPPRGWPDALVGHELFLSYASVDVRFVRALGDRLSGAGYRVFDYDAPSCPRRDREIWARIERELERAWVRVPVFSRGFLASSHCRRELAQVEELVATSRNTTRHVIAVQFGIDAEELRAAGLREPADWDACVGTDPDPVADRLLERLRHLEGGPRNPGPG